MLITTAREWLMPCFSGSIYRTSYKGLHSQALDIVLAESLEAVGDVLGIRVDEGAVREVPSRARQ